MIARLVAVILVCVVAVVAAPAWLPSFGSALAEDDPLQPADVALVLEGTGATATSVAETWRQQGLVHDVVVVKAPVKTHALVAYWRPSNGAWRRHRPRPRPTCASCARRRHKPGEQATAAMPALEADAARSVLVLGGGGIGSRLVERQISDVLRPASISTRIVGYGDGGRDPAHWYQNAEDRRAVLDGWLQVLVPYLSGYDESGA